MHSWIKLKKKIYIHKKEEKRKSLVWRLLSITPITWEVDVGRPRSEINPGKSKRPYL
jgi:hypothetical protein